MAGRRRAVAAIGGLLAAGCVLLCVGCLDRSAVRGQAGRTGLLQQVLGSFDATPTLPALGTVLWLRADLPSGIDGFVLFGRPNDYGAPPFSQPRIYCDLGSAVMLPTPLSGQSQLPIPIPAAPQLVGVELFFHLLAAPRLGTTAPPLALPPGRRVRIS